MTIEKVSRICTSRSAVHKKTGIQARYNCYRRATAAAAMLQLPDSICVSSIFPFKSSSIFILITILCLCQTTLQNDQNAASPSTPPEDMDKLDSLPYFEQNATIISNLTVHIGETISMDCRVNVNRLGDKMVSWMKRDEKGSLKLLTVGPATYSTDSRYSLAFEEPNNWQLRLHSVQKTDAGLYQCTINAHPPRILRYILNVVAPTVEIVDDGDKPLKDKIFKTDSTLELRCIVRQVLPANPQNVKTISWYHRHPHLNYDVLLNNDTRHRGGISVKSEVRNDYGIFITTSRLLIANLNVQETGYYSCSMGRFGRATVFVSVVNGETPAAMQHGHASTRHLLPVFFSSPPLNFPILTTFLALITLCFFTV